MQTLRLSNKIRGLAACLEMGAGRQSLGVRPQEWRLASCRTGRPAQAAKLPYRPCSCGAKSARQSTKSLCREVSGHSPAGRHPLLERRLSLLATALQRAQTDFDRRRREHLAFTRIGLEGPCTPPGATNRSHAAGRPAVATSPDWTVILSALHGPGPPRSGRSPVRAADKPFSARCRSTSRPSTTCLA
jgi:hypothetical protein